MVYDNIRALADVNMFFATLPGAKVMDIELALRNLLSIFVIISFSLYIYIFFALIVLLVILQDFSFMYKVPFHLNST